MRHRDPGDHVGRDIEAEEEEPVGERLGADDLLARDVDAREGRPDEDADDDQAEQLAGAVRS